MKRFQQEVRAAAQLNHANIVTDRDADQPGYDLRRPLHVHLPRGYDASSSRRSQPPALRWKEVPDKLHRDQLHRGTADPERSRPQLRDQIHRARGRPGKREYHYQDHAGYRRRQVEQLESRQVVSGQPVRKPIVAGHNDSVGRVLPRQPIARVLGLCPTSGFRRRLSQ